MQALALLMLAGALARGIARAAALAAAAACLPSALAQGHPVQGLAQGRELSCQPALPQFCSNVHVSCAGQTSIATFAFKLRAQRTQGALEVSTGESVGSHELAAPFAQSQLTWAAGGEDVLFTPSRGPGYLRLLADGRFSLRLYQGEAGIMAYGRCG